jgi:hypothetical protein
MRLAVGATGATGAARAASRPRSADSHSSPDASSLT